ncbi:uncharacterized protein ARMOST_21077 [Armillaria ostoyae]|uniref:Uncharacterized protein n=1 Tax=Armillaria ostoyae TaxID=47428 RepID=A0A284S957_ARMOS|nr:uncharacterized protein ARMOST_21077 [Armillaria ostoyae]
MTSFDFDVVSPADLTVTQLDETVAVALEPMIPILLFSAMAGGSKALYDPLLRAVTRALVLEGKIWLTVSNGRIVGVLGGFGPGKFLWATSIYIFKSVY